MTGGVEGQVQFFDLRIVSGQFGIPLAQNFDQIFEPVDALVLAVEFDVDQLAQSLFGIRHPLFESSERLRCRICGLGARRRRRRNVDDALFHRKLIDEFLELGRGANAKLHKRIIKTGKVNVTFPSLV